MRLHILGTGCPHPLAERFGSAFVLELGGDPLLVDCGPATTYKMARMGLDPTRIGRVFFTHHHFDHNVDFPCFVLTRWDQSTGTEPPLQVYGPPPTRAFVQALIGAGGAFHTDWQSRITHPASHECHELRGGDLPRPGPAVEAGDVGDGAVAASDTWRASAATVHHVEPTMISLAYRFDTDEGPVVFAGDCGDCTALRQLARGAATLVITCTHFGEKDRIPAIVDVCTGTPEVAAIATEAGAGRVILTHTSPTFSRPGVRERAIAEVKQGFDGEVVLPDELTTLEL